LPVPFLTRSAQGSYLPVTSGHLVDLAAAKRPLRAR
jgi:hypothetical protein